MNLVASPLRDTPLLSTKVYVPTPGAGLVPRPRLMERLAEGLNYPLTLVCAPAGFGKTTAVSAWLSTLGFGDLPRAWVSLDQGDNDPWRFCLYFVTALERIDPGIGELFMALYQTPEPPPIRSVIGTSINALARINEDFVLVLDDYHIVETPSVHDAVGFLLQHMPAGMHLMITTRSDPPLPLARLRARGQMLELRAGDLRFDAQEAARFFNEFMGLDLSPEDVAMLEGRTEGWIAGLKLAALSMRGRKDRAELIKAISGSHRYIVDYLAEEVLNSQPPELQEFMLATSILGRMSGPLCDAVLGSENSQAVLERLEERNLFVTPLDYERRWYRYHHLFAEFLRERLHRSGREAVREFHRRAAAWYESKGLSKESIDHALVGGDRDRARRLIEAESIPTIARSEIPTISGWISKLPEESVRGSARLQIARGWVSLFEGRSQAIEADLQNAEEALEAGIGLPESQGPGLDPGLMRCEITALRAYVARIQGNLPLAIELCERALGELPDDAALLRGAVELNLGCVYRMIGDLNSASRIFESSVARSESGDCPYAAMVAIVLLAQNLMLQGRLGEMERLQRQAADMIERRGWRFLPAAGLLLVGMAELAYERNDLDTAARHLQEGLALGQQGATLDALTMGYLLSARVRAAQGDIAAARDLMDRVDELGPLYNDPACPPMAAWRARLELWRGDPGLALRWAESSGLGPDDVLDFAKEFHEGGFFPHTVLVRALVAAGEHQEAARLAERLAESARQGGRTRAEIEATALQALALYAGGNTPEALRLLDRALSLAEPEGHLRLLADEGEPMASLLREARARGASRPYVDRILEAMGPLAESPSKTPDQTALVEPLSERELEVLRLIAAGLVNQEIADQLFVAVSTVKKHINSIYGKLGVTTRTRAVVRARELALID